MGRAKKESYFTPQTILEKSQRMLLDCAPDQHLERLRQYDPRRSALLVLDMQEYFLHPSSHAWVPSAGPILSGVQSLVSAYAARGLPIVFSRHLNTPQDAGRMSTWWRHLIADGDELSRLTPALDTGAGITLVKTQYDAFFHTALEALLQARQVTQVVICGVMTHLCCETTARSAFMRGFEVFFTVDGTATYTEAYHRAALLNLAHGFATPVLVSELLPALDETSHGHS